MAKQEKRGEVMTFNLEEITLEAGKHESQEKGVCIMEAVSIAAGEPFTDFPKCTDRVISRCAQVLNDRMPEDLRNELLKPLVFRMIGTNGDLKLKTKRMFIAADWSVRIILPTLFDLIGKKEWAEKLRYLAPIIDQATAVIARNETNKIKSAAAAYVAAYAAAYAAAVAYAAADAADSAATAAATAAHAADSAATTAAYAADSAAKKKIWTLAVDMLIAMIEAK